VGLVGAGRTEIVRAIFGADRAKELKISINGKPVNIKNPRHGKKEGVGLVPEDRKLEGLVLPFSVQSNITMSSLDKISTFGFINPLLEKEIADRQIKNLSVKTPSPHTKVVTLSGGNQQKCIMGRWLEINPDILILDEPTRGIDVGTKYEIYVLIKKIAEAGGSVIMISSELPEVLAMSNRVITICEGRITGEFNPETDSPNVIMDAAIG
jgi:ribose transport system ATP-binding protein